jgi:FSR family fosmidomycin resistance protein-like MFS transporter
LTRDAASTPAIAREAPRRRKDLWGAGLLSTGHMLVDMYLTFIPPLWPLFIQRYSLSLTTVGVVTTVLSVLVLPVQPVTGHIVDRRNPRILFVVGPVLSALAFSFLGVVPAFWMVVLLMAIGRAGNSLYHPPSAKQTMLSAGASAGLVMAFYQFSGNIGLGMGPVVLPQLIAWIGLEWSWLACIPGLILAAVLYARFVRVPSGVESGASVRAAQPAPAGRIPMSVALVMLIAVMTVRSGVYQGFTTFGPEYLVRRGATLAQAGFAISSINLVGATLGLAMGALSDRFGRRSILFVCMLITTFALSFFMLSPGTTGVWWLAVAGSGLVAVNSVMVVMAQEMHPAHEATASGLIVGFAFGLGSVFSAPAGMIADHFGLPAALWSLTALAALTPVLILLVPMRRRRAASTT